MDELNMPAKGLHTLTADEHTDQCACCEILDKDAMAFQDTHEQHAVVVELNDLTIQGNQT